MSRSYHKSNTDSGAFVSEVNYDSNKEDKRCCNRKFRRKSHDRLHTDCVNGNFEEHMNFQKTKEVSDIVDFSSYGKKHYEKASDMSEGRIDKLRRK